MIIVSERPILFNGAMVRAILAGRKTQTRRLMKRPPPADLLPGRVGLDSERMSEWIGETVTGEQWRSRCEVADIGDALWVRENVFAAPPNFGDADTNNATDSKGQRRLVGYVASMDAEARRCARDFGVKMTPSIHMARWAARLILPVVDVRPQRLHDISEEDARAEGTQEPSVAALIGGGDVTERRVFARLWTATYGRASWDANPWVWAVTFRRGDDR